MSAGHTPETSFELAAEWFARAAKSATAKGSHDSAQLWSDGLQHLTHLNAERDRLKAANAELVEACEASNQCITDLIGVYTNQSSLLILDEAVKSLRDDALKLVRAALAKHQGETA